MITVLTVECYMAYLVSVKQCSHHLWDDALVTHPINDESLHVRMSLHHIHINVHNPFLLTKVSTRNGFLPSKERRTKMQRG